MGNYLITGGNSEIGRELIMELDRRGHTVFTTSRSKLKYTAPCAYLDGIDLTCEDDVLGLFTKVAEVFASPFNVIHSVGDFWYHKTIENTPLDQAAAMISSHYLTLYAVIRHAVPLMSKVGGGRVLAFTCNSVKYNYPEMAAFTSAKAAVECLIKCVANEYSSMGITANAFALPSIKTDQVLSSKPAELTGNFISMNELARSIEDIVEHLPQFANGNVISLFKHSDTFYHKGYYERNIFYNGDAHE
ncbi:MAG: SDR family oxidoreductase [Oscillospiraceae bacterium]|jgi:NAD(P)-dependent dehydrogenase (short-subunit alcohol dehydrogenase family)|nr:SDR family oxidoreductase [Oscillospiraceae bacterium]